MSSLCQILFYRPLQDWIFASLHLRQDFLLLNLPPLARPDQSQRRVSNTRFVLAHSTRLEARVIGRFGWPWLRLLFPNWVVTRASRWTVHALSLDPPKVPPPSQSDESAALDSALAQFRRLSRRNKMATATEEDTELRDLLVQTLETSGVLNKIKVRNTPARTPGLQNGGGGCHAPTWCWGGCVARRY